MESRELENGLLGRTLNLLGGAIFIGGLLTVLILALSNRNQLATALDRGAVPFWPLPVVFAGAVLFVLAKWSIIRRGRYFSLGTTGMSPMSTALYVLGYALMVVGYAFSIGTVLGVN